MIVRIWLSEKSCAEIFRGKKKPNLDNRMENRFIDSSLKAKRYGWVSLGNASPTITSYAMICWPLSNHPHHPTCTNFRIIRMLLLGEFIGCCCSCCCCCRSCCCCCSWCWCSVKLFVTNHRLRVTNTMAIDRFNLVERAQIYVSLSKMRCSK